MSDLLYWLHLASIALGGAADNAQGCGPALARGAYCAGRFAGHRSFGAVGIGDKII